MAVKSDLQKRLESDGWTHLTNEDPSTEVKSVPASKPRVERGPNGIMMYVGVDEYTETRIQRRARPLTDEEIRQEFLNRPGFKEVLVASAYDVNGIPLPAHRAVYVKRG